MRARAHSPIILLALLALSLLPAASGEPAQPAPAPEQKTELELPSGAVARLGPFVPTGYVYSVAFSPDGRTLAVNQSHTIRLCDTVTWKETLVIPGAVDAVAYSPDGKTLATGGPASTVVLRDAATLKERLVLQGHEKPPIHSVVFSPDGLTLASASIADKTVRLWDVETGKERLKLANRNEWTKSVAFSPDGRIFAWGDGDVVRLSSVESGETLREIRSEKERAFRVAWSPDGETVATTALKTRLWDAATGQERLTVPVAGCRPFILFSPDGRWLATPAMDQTVVLFEAASGRELLRLKDNRRSYVSNAAAVSPDGRLLATGQWGSTVIIWDVAALLKDRK